MVQLPRALLVAQRVSGGKREVVKIENCIKVSTVRFWWRKKRNHENEKPLTIVSKSTVRLCWGKRENRQEI